jgi:hypothetical protein
MLKEDPQFEYIEIESDPEPAVARMYSRPVAGVERHHRIEIPSSPQRQPRFTPAPLQSYLRERYANFSMKGESYRRIRRENQRRHDLAGGKGSWPMNRTS